MPRHYIPARGSIRATLSALKFRAEEEATRAVYSTSEVDTGQVYFNGATIYRKVYDLGALPNATSKNVALSLASGIQYVIRFSGFVTSAAGARSPLPLISPTAAENIGIDITQTNIVIKTGADHSLLTGTLVLEYTRV